MDPFTMARLLIGDMQLTAGQLAQLRAINTKYFTELYALLQKESGQDLTALDAVIARDIRDILTEEQRTVLDRNLPKLETRHMAQTNVGDTYLRSILRTYRMYKDLGERAIAQVESDADLHRPIDPESNSIAIIVKHVAGNLRSRFRDFLTSDGEKPDRNRDSEFETTDAVSRDEILRWWNDGWGVVLESVEGLTPEDLVRTVTIRREEMLVLEALNRSVTHTAYHVGQIVYVARHLAGQSWKSLSIPKRQSASVTPPA